MLTDCCYILKVDVGRPQPASLIQRTWLPPMAALIDNRPYAVPFSDGLASWGGPEFDWNTLQDICHVDSGTLLLPFDEYLPELTFECGFGLGRVPGSACAGFNPVDLPSKFPDTTYGLLSVPSNPNPALYYSDKGPFLDVNQLRLSHQQSGVVYHDPSDYTPRVPEPGPPVDQLSSLSPNPESQLVPPNGSIPSPQPRAEETGAVSQKRKRGCKDTTLLLNVQDESGRKVGTFLQWGHTTPLRKTMNKAERKSYQINRNFGACEECRRRKKACNRSCAPYIKCLNSKSLVFLDTPESCRLFRPRPSAGHPLASAHQGIYTLSELVMRGSPPVELHITQGVNSKMAVYVGQFEATPEYKTRHIWRCDNELKELDLPPFCLAYMEYMKTSVCDYIQNSWCSYLREITLRSDPISLEILLEAQKIASSNKTSLVMKALKLLAVNRMIELDWVICGTETLGQPPVSDPKSPWYGRVPVTPVMDTQLDQIVIQEFLNPLREDLLRGLQNKMYSKQKGNWFEIFLVTFILCLNTEWLLRHSRMNAKRYGARQRYNSMKLAEEYFHGTRILLAHFHHLCGTTPLLLSSQVNSTDQVGPLQSHQVKLLRRIQELISNRQLEFAEMKRCNRYEDDLYWCHQVFAKSWIPGPPAVEDDI